MLFSLGSYASEFKAALAVEQHEINMESEQTSPDIPLYTNKDMKVYENNLNLHQEPSPFVPHSTDQRIFKSDSASFPTEVSTPGAPTPAAPSSTLPAVTITKLAEKHSAKSSPASTPSEDTVFFNIPMSAFWWGISITIFVLTLGSVLLIMRDIKNKSIQSLNKKQSKTSRNSHSMAINHNNPLPTNTVQLKPARKLIEAAGKNNDSAATLIATALNPSIITHTTQISASATIDPAMTSNDASATIQSLVELNSSSTAALILDQTLEPVAVLTPVEPASPATPEPPYHTTILSNAWQLFGISKQGQAHLAKAPAIPCQDSHYIQQISDDWGVVVVCDGAGSQSHSQHGAKFVAKEIAEHLAAGIPETNIYKTQQLPSPEVWNQYCKILVKKTRIKLEEWVAGSLEIEGATIRDVGCTLIWAVYTPMGLLTGHVGDGRAGYRDAEGWHAMMTPWEGEYSNQTVFINTDSIYADQLENQADSTRPFLESRVIDNPNIDAFVLMSDGCESGLYETVTYDAEKNTNVKINLPHAGVCNNIIEMLEKKMAETNSDSHEAERMFTNIVEEGNTALKTESDDKTLVLGFLNKPMPVLNIVVQV